MESHWRILSREGIWLTQPFLPAYLYHKSQEKWKLISQASFAVRDGFVTQFWPVKCKEKSNWKALHPAKSLISWWISFFDWVSLFPSFLPWIWAQCLEWCSHPATMRERPGLSQSPQQWHSGAVAAKPTSCLDFLPWENRNPWLLITHLMLGSLKSECLPD